MNPATVTSRRPISSVTPTQTFDKLSTDCGVSEPGKGVYKKTIENWSNPDNKASYPWSTEDGQDDMSQLHLPAVSVWRKERITWHM